MQIEPHKNHLWLEQLVGQWTYESDASMGPDKPRETSTGSESVRAIRKIWIVAEGRTAAEGHISIMTLGYDPQK